MGRRVRGRRRLAGGWVRVRVRVYWPKLSPLPILITPPLSLGWSLLVLPSGKFLYV